MILNQLKILCAIVEEGDVRFVLRVHVIAAQCTSGDRQAVSLQP